MMFYWSLKRWKTWIPIEEEMTLKRACSDAGLRLGSVVQNDNKFCFFFKKNQLPTTAFKICECSSAVAALFLLYISKTLFCCARKVTAFFLFSIKPHHFRTDTPWKFQMEDSDKPLFNSHWASQIKSKLSFPEKANYIGHFPLGWSALSICDDTVNSII